MSYVIATYKEGKPYGIIACSLTNQFRLIPLDSNVALNKIYSHPYRAGAYNILTWIKNNDNELSGEELDVFDEARFSK
jgi:hypothetical protein